MSKSKNKTTKKAFIQEWGTYSNQTIVSVGMDVEDMLKYLKRIKAKYEIVKNLAANKEVIEKFLLEKCASCHIDRENGATILFFPEWKNDWEHWDTLIHEVTHLVHAVLGKMKNMMDEDEARAYQTEYLFREIRRKLWKLIP